MDNPKYFPTESGSFNNNINSFTKKERNEQVNNIEEFWSFNPGKNKNVEENLNENFVERNIKKVKELLKNKGEISYNPIKFVNV